MRADSSLMLKEKTVDNIKKDFIGLEEHAQQRGIIL